MDTDDEACKFNLRFTPWAKTPWPINTARWLMNIDFAIQGYMVLCTLCDAFESTTYWTEPIWEFVSNRGQGETDDSNSILLSESGIGIWASKSELWECPLVSFWLRFGCPRKHREVMNRSTVVTNRVIKDGRIRRGQVVNSLCHQAHAFKPHGKWVLASNVIDRLKTLLQRLYQCAGFDWKTVVSWSSSMSSAVGGT